jgi:glycosyltransferase involved in cell wall biosynthesis
MEVHTVHVEASFKRKNFLMNLLFSEKPYTATRFMSMVFESELIQLIRSTTFDVIQLEGLYLTPYIKAIRQNSGSLIALRAHNIEHEIWERNAFEEKALLKKKYFEILAKRIRNFEFSIINLYDLLVPITNRDLEKFNSMGNKRPAHVCPAGINEIADTGNPKDLSWESDLFSLYYLGSLDWIPNQEGLLWFVRHVFPTLRQHCPDLRLHVAGRNAPKSLIKKIDMPGIVFHGEVDDSRQFSKDHSVMIAPCFSGGGMRLKIIEAMSMGKVVVTTAIGAEGLSVKDGENIFIADDANHFCEAIEKLMNNPDICRKIGLQALIFVKENCNNLDIAASLAEFYNSHLK